MQNFQVLTPEFETRCARCKRTFVTQQVAVYRFTYPAERFCPVCREAERAEDEERKSQILLAQAQLPREFVACSFDNFERAPGNHHAYDRARDWARQFATGRMPVRGLIFVGAPGTGKTHLSVAIVRAAICTGGIRCLFINVPAWLNAIREAWHSNDVQEPPNPAGYQLVVIDDLGAENATAWARERIYSLLNQRLQERVLTIATTNLTLDELRPRLGRASLSRLRQLCVEVPIEGVDFRLGTGTG